MKTIILLLISTFGFFLAQGQNTLQVATRTVDRNEPANGIRTLHINAEKADIELSVWDKNEIQVKLELSARHPDRSAATADLAKISYVAERSGRDYFLRNYILLKEGEAKPVSNLKARYIVFLPASCAVNLKSSFGTLILKGVSTSLRLKADFCSISLHDISGKGDLETTFGELRGKSISGNYSFLTNHTNLHLDNIGGAVRVNAQYGNIDIFPASNLNSLSIQSKKAVISMLSKDWQQFDYTINSAFTTIKLPSGFKWKRNTTDFKDAFFDHNRTAHVEINSEFGDLVIR